jgi:hypothetical protein
MTMNRVLASLTLSLFACATSTGDGDDGSLAADLSSADAQRVVDLVNYPGTDAALLDGPVGLDSRAAKAIIAKRNGADGISPSADDLVFTTIDDVDAVAFVGSSALGKLATYAGAHPAPAGEVVEGVPFAGWESESVVFGVNNATEAQLDAFLDKRAASGLITKRPFTTVTQMGPVNFVGASALTALRKHAPAFWAQSHGGANCVADFEAAVQPHLGDLLFLSESDRPIDIVTFPGAGATAPTAASFFALLHEPSDWTFESRDPSNYFVDFEPESATADPNAGALVQIEIASRLTGVIYVAVHQPAGSEFQSEVAVYLVGRTSCGDLVALHAISIET